MDMNMMKKFSLLPIILIVLISFNNYAADIKFTSKAFFLFFSQVVVDVIAAKLIKIFMSGFLTSHKFNFLWSVISPP